MPPCWSGRGWSVDRPNERPMRHHAAAFRTPSLTWRNDNHLALVLRGIACQLCGREKLRGTAGGEDVELEALMGDPQSAKPPVQPDGPDDAEAWSGLMRGA